MDPSKEEDDGLSPDIEEAFAAVDAIGEKPTKGEAKAAKEKEKEESKMMKDLHKMSKEKGPEPEDVSKHQEKLMTLTRWGAHDRFKAYLSDQGFTLTVGALKKKSLGELEELEQRVRICVGARGQSTFISQLALVGVYWVECIATSSENFKMRFDVTGVSDSLKQNDTFLDAIAQLEMDYASFSSFGPKTRIVIQILMAMSQANNANQALKSIQQMSADALEALNNPQPAAEGPKPIIPGRRGAAAEEMDIPMPADPVA